jgi:hypothetical protein
MACPYTSNARNMHKARSEFKPAGKTFIGDVKAQSDLCSHPYNLDLHGFTSGKEIHVDGNLKPVFSLSKTSLHADILAVPTEQWFEDLPVIPWAERTSEKLLWRGSNTGIHYSKDTPWQQSQRIRAVNLTRPNAAGTVDILPPAMYPNKKAQLSEAVSHVPAAELNSKMFDVSFAGSPIRKSYVCPGFGICVDTPLINRMRCRGWYLRRAARLVRLPKDPDDFRGSPQLQIRFGHVCSLALLSIAIC